jgi:hypothetical protein
MQEMLTKFATVNRVSPSRHIPNKTKMNNMISTLPITGSVNVKSKWANFNFFTAKQLPKKITQSITGKPANE